MNQESDRYVLALEYCTRDALVSDWVWAKGKQILSSGSGNWNSLWNKYKSSSKHKWEPSDIDSNLEKFKNKCTSEYSTPAGNVNSISVLRILEYCSEDRPKSP